MLGKIKVFLPLMLIALLLTSIYPQFIRGAEDQPVMVKSKNNFSDTVTKLKEAIKNQKLAIIFEANHKNMMAMVGIKSKNSITIGFARPQMGNMLLSAEPRASIEMPMRVAVRELDNGDIMVIYYQPSYMFAHYKNEKLGMIGKKMDGMVGSMVRAATE